MAGLYPGIMPPLIVPPAFMIPFLLKIYPGVAGYYFYADPNITYMWLIVSILNYRLVQKGSRSSSSSSRTT